MPGRGIHKGPRAGFTLIELSIVLVIIGLIVGGVLVGQDMIKNSELRATVGQLEKYNAAVNTFRGKYGGLPGDLRFTEASSYGMFTFSSGLAGTAGMGDGNGLIYGTSGRPTGPAGETLVFWRHLSDASLIDGVYGTTGNGLLDGTGHPLNTVTIVSQSLPPAKVGGGKYIIVYTSGGRNHYSINAIRDINVDFNLYSAAGSNLTPLDAYNLDLKIDDGKPNTGNVIARGAGGFSMDVAPSTGASGCVLGTTPADSYNIVSQTYNCALRVAAN